MTFYAAIQEKRKAKNNKRYASNDQNQLDDAYNTNDVEEQPPTQIIHHIPTYTKHTRHARASYLLNEHTPIKRTTGIVFESQQQNKHIIKQKRKRQKSLINRLRSNERDEKHYCPIKLVINDEDNQDYESIVLGEYDDMDESREKDQDQDQDKYDDYRGPKRNRPHIIFKKYI